MAPEPDTRAERYSLIPFACPHPSKCNHDGCHGCEEPITSRTASAAAAMREAHVANGDKSGGKASYWLRRAAATLDLAVQCCGTEDSTEIDAMERRCDELADKLAEQGR